MVSIWGTFWLLQHAIIMRPGCNLARLCIPSGPIQGEKAIACRSTTNGFIRKRIFAYCKLEREQMRFIKVRQSFWMFYESKFAIFQTYRTWNCALGPPLSKFDSARKYRNP